MNDRTTKSHGNRRGGSRLGRRTDLAQLRRPLLVEPLESRHLLAGDIPPLVDIRTIPDPAASAFLSSSGRLAEVNGVLYLAADDGIHGDEFWKSDGTASGTVLLKDIRNGPDGSNIFLLSDPSRMIKIGGNVFMVANDGTHGRELWKSDGTPNGTVMIKDIWPGPSASVSGPVLVGDKFYFSADDGIHGRELWKSDGTAEGTVLVKDIFHGPQASSISAVKANVNGTLFFTANDGTHGGELWKSDGTAQGTVMVKDIRPGPQSSESTPHLNFGGKLFFGANNGVNGRELWTSDGTPEGTFMVKDIDPGNNSFYASAFGLTEANGILFFVAWDPVHGQELWKTDGTTEGTVLVKDIRPGAANPGISEITNVNGMLYFRANDGTHGSELWKSDGTPEGTVIVKDIRTGSGWSEPRFLTNIRGTLYFTADDGIYGRELWKSDGTEEGTVMVANIANAGASSDPHALTVMGDYLYFTAFTASYGRELYRVPLDGVTGSVVGSHVYYRDSSFAASGMENAFDSSKQLAKEGTEPVTLGVNNLINTSRGINAVVFDMQNLPGSLTTDDSQFQVSPLGAFIEADHPPVDWSSAPAPSSITVQSGAVDRVVIEWPDNAIANRWLRVTVKANDNTRLSQPEVYYLGHLLGEISGPSASGPGGLYTVTFADAALIREQVGTTVDPTSSVDIDKNGVVAFADISVMRTSVGTQLRNITIGNFGVGSGASPMMPSGSGDRPGADSRSSGSIFGGSRFFNAAPLVDALQPLNGGPGGPLDGSGSGVSQPMSQSSEQPQLLSPSTPSSPQQRSDRYSSPETLLASLSGLQAARKLPPGPDSSKAARDSTGNLETMVDLLQDRWNAQARLHAQVDEYFDEL